MIDIKQIPILLKENSCNNWRIKDIYKNTLYVCTGLEIEDAIIKFNEVWPLFVGMDKLLIQGATDVQVKGNWNGAFIWRVEMAQSPVAAGNLGGIGYVPEAVATLSKELAILNLKHDHEKQIRGLTDKLNNKDLIPDKWIPVIAKLLGVDINSAVLSGPPDTTSQTDEAILNLVLSVNSKIGSEKFLILLKAIDRDPALADKAIIFIS